MFRALVTFSGPGGRVVSEGDELDDNDPILEGRGRLFERFGPAPIERATAAPGERRSASRASK
jgi:hypothetical protein